MIVSFHEGEIQGNHVGWAKKCPRREFRRTGDLRAGCCQSEEDSHCSYLKEEGSWPKTQAMQDSEARAEGCVGQWREEGMRVYV